VLTRFSLPHTNVERNLQPKAFPELFQDSGLDSFATHASGTHQPGIYFPFDRSDDGGSKPRLREDLRFASFAPHNLP
jgi:hypothetical protein